MVTTDHAAAGKDPRVIVVDDPGDIMFDDAQTPLLTFDHHPKYGGWRLDYMDVDGRSDDYKIGGEESNVDWAIE